jgi:hypothetical protein
VEVTPILAPLRTPLRTPLRRTLAIAVAVATLLAATAVADTGPSGATVKLVTTTSCGGKTIKKANGTSWVCTLDDEFSSPALSTKLWTAMDTAKVGARGGQECDTPQNLSIANGVLVIAARHLPSQTRCGRYSVKYTSGGITSSAKFAQTYGRFEMRAKFPAGIGYQPAFWMLPQNPSSKGSFEYGEIDVAEAYGRKPEYVDPHLHYVSTPGTPGNGKYCTVATNSSAFHTYALEWTPTQMTFVYDGATCWSTSWKPKPGYGGGGRAPAPFDQPFYVMVQLAVGGSMTPTNTPKASTVFPGNLSVDYIRVWK